MVSDSQIKSHSADVSNELSLRDLVLLIRKWYRYLFSKKMLIITVAILGSVLGLTYSYIKKPIFIAETTFVLEDSEGGGMLGQYSGLASIAGIDIGGEGGGIFRGDNILELYKSRSMVEKTLLSKLKIDGREQLLIDLYIEMNHLKDSWKDKPLLSNLKFDQPDKTGVDSVYYSYKSPKVALFRARDSILQAVVKDINKNYLQVSKPDKKLSIILVEVRAKDETFAKALNNLIVKNVNDFYVETKTKKSINNVIILQQKVDSVRAVMRGSIYRAANVTDATPNLNLTRQVQRVAPIQTAQFSIETNKVVLSELVKNLELSKISLRKETPLIQVIDQPVLPLEKSQPGVLGGIIIGGLLTSILVIVGLSVRKIFKVYLA